MRDEISQRALVGEQRNFAYRLGSPPVPSERHAGRVRPPCARVGSSARVDIVSWWASTRMYRSTAATASRISSGAPSPGRATFKRRRRTTSIPLAQASSQGLRFMNTFDNFFTGDMQRHIGEGPMFGHRASRTFEYLLVDKVSAGRLSSSRVRSRMPYPSDDTMLALSLDLALHLHLPPRRRTGRKTIGWWPQHPEQYDQLVRSAMPQAMTTISAISDAILASARAPRGNDLARVAARQEATRARLHCARISAAERSALVQSMWDARHVIISGKKTCHALLGFWVISEGEVGELVICINPMRRCHFAKRRHQYSRSARYRIRGLMHTTPNLSRAR